MQSILTSVFFFWNQITFNIKIPLGLTKPDQPMSKVGILRVPVHCIGERSMLLLGNMPIRENIVAK